MLDADACHQQGNTHVLVAIAGTVNCLRCLLHLCAANGPLPTVLLLLLGAVCCMLLCETLRNPHWLLLEELLLLPSCHCGSCWCRLSYKGAVTQLSPLQQFQRAAKQQPLSF